MHANTAVNAAPNPLSVFGLIEPKSDAMVDMVLDRLEVLKTKRPSDQRIDKALAYVGRIMRQRIMDDMALAA